MIVEEPKEEDADFEDETKVGSEYVSSTVHPLRTQGLLLLKDALAA